MRLVLTGQRWRNRSKDKLIGDSTGGVWLPVAEPRPRAGFTRVKLLSETGRVRRDVGGWVGFFSFTPSESYFFSSKESMSTFCHLRP